MSLPLNLSTARVRWTVFGQQLRICTTGPCRRLRTCYYPRAGGQTLSAWAAANSILLASGSLRKCERTTPARPAYGLQRIAAWE